jgi:hypothetical protein
MKSWYHLSPGPVWSGSPRETLILIFDSCLLTFDFLSLQKLIFAPIWFIVSWNAGTSTFLNPGASTVQTNASGYYVFIHVQRPGNAAAGAVVDGAIHLASGRLAESGRGNHVQQGDPERVRAHPLAPVLLTRASKRMRLQSSADS